MRVPTVPERCVGPLPRPAGGWPWRAATHEDQRMHHPPRWRRGPHDEQPGGRGHRPGHRGTFEADWPVPPHGPGPPTTRRGHAGPGPPWGLCAPCRPSPAHAPSSSRNQHRATPAHRLPRYVARWHRAAQPGPHRAALSDHPRWLPRPRTRWNRSPGFRWAPQAGCVAVVGHEAGSPDPMR